MSPVFRPPNHRDVGEMLGLWLDVSPIAQARLLRGGRLDAMTTAEDLGSPRTILNLRRGPDPGHLAGIQIVHLAADDSVENYDTRQRVVRAWMGNAIAVLTAEDVRFPVYVHCTSGRDRTGVVIAAILLAIGVPRSVVAEEYMLSDGAERARIEVAIDGISDWLPTSGVDRERLRSALA